MVLKRYLNYLRIYYPLMKFFDYLKYKIGTKYYILI